MPDYDEDKPETQIAHPLKYCPFRPKMPCITGCALYCDDFEGCAIKKMAYTGVV